METQTWLDLQLPWKWWPFWNPSTGNLPVTVSLLEAMRVISFCCFFLRTRTTFFVCWLKLPKHPYTWIRTLLHPHKKGTVTVFHAVHKNIRTTKTISPHDFIIVIFALYVYKVYQFIPFLPGIHIWYQRSQGSLIGGSRHQFIPVRHILRLVVSLCFIVLCSLSSPIWVGHSWLTDSHFLIFLMCLCPCGTMNYSP